MFLRFSAENHRSFRDSVEVSFISTRQKDEPSYRIPCSVVQHGVLPILAIFGANASGKSNLVRTITHIVDHVRSSFRMEPGQPISRAPFRMDRQKPTTFTLDLMVESTRIHYGFRFDDQKYREEWLYQWPEGTKQVVFHRDSQEAEPYYFGPTLKGAKRTIANATRDNALFLSTAAQMNHPSLTRVATAIVDGVAKSIDFRPNTSRLFQPDSVLLRPESKSIITDMLRASDLGISDFRARRRPNSSDPMFDDGSEGSTPQHTDGLAPTYLPAAPPMQIVLFRQDPDGREWSLDPSQESSGTHSFLSHLERLLPTLQAGKLIVMDEFDAGLHPDLCAAILRMFSSKSTNPNGAQLLLATHSRDLLTDLRRDQVILVDKDPFGVSHVQMASDFSDLRKREDLRRVYEQGRIGGVPVLGEFSLSGLWVAE